MAAGVGAEPTFYPIINFARENKTVPSNYLVHPRRLELRTMGLQSTAFPVKLKVR